MGSGGVAFTIDEDRPKSNFENSKIRKLFQAPWWFLNFNLATRLIAFLRDISQSSPLYLGPEPLLLYLILFYCDDELAPCRILHHLLETQYNRYTNCLL